MAVAALVAVTAPTVDAVARSASTAPVARAAVARLQVVCVARDHEVRVPAGRSCARNETRRALAVSRRLSLCASRGDLLQVGAAACRRVRGTRLLVPAARASYFCSARRGGDLRSVRRTSACRSSERPWVSADRPPAAPGLTSSAVAEDSAPGTAVGRLRATDPDVGDRLRFRLVTGAGDDDNASFTLDGTVLRTAVPLDFETRPQLHLRVAVTDLLGLSRQQALTVSVTDVPENRAPTGVHLTPASVLENQPSGTTVGSLTADDPDLGDAHTFALVAGEGDDDNAAFSLAGDVLSTAASFDYEGQALRTVRVRATDGGGESVDTALTVAVVNANDTPGPVDLSPSTVAENQPVGTVVGTLAAPDDDEGDAVGFSLVAGSGDDDNASFDVDGAQLRTSRVIDFETDPSLTVRVRADDGNGGTVERDLVIAVGDVNETPAAENDAVTGGVGNTQATFGTVSGVSGPTAALAGALLLTDDTDPDGDPLSVVPATAQATSQGGRVDMYADGSFRYLPPVGLRDATDTFGYTVTDGALTDTATVSVAIGHRRVWWVDADAPAGGDGRSVSPAQSLAPFASGGPDGVDDEIFVDDGTYGQPTDLAAGQQLVGRRAGLPGLVAPGGSGATILTATYVVRMADRTRIAGLNLTGTGSNPTVLAQTGVTTAVVDDDVTVTATGSGTPVDLGSGSGNVTVDATIENRGAGLTLRVIGRSGGTVRFGGPITAPTGAPHGGIEVGSNPGTAVELAGRLDLTTQAAFGLYVEGTGSLVVTGTGNRIVTTGAAALVTSGTRFGTAGLTFASLTSSGAQTGVSVDGSGKNPADGSLVVTGTATAGLCGGSTSAAGAVVSLADPAACTGGRISGATGVGILLKDTRRPQLTRVHVDHAAGDGILAQDVVGGMLVDRSLIDGVGTRSFDHGISVGTRFGFTSANGTYEVRSTTVRDSADSGVSLAATSGTSELVVSGSQVVDSKARGLGILGHGVDVDAQGTASSALTLSGSSLRGNRGAQVRAFANDSGSMRRADVVSNTLSGTSGTGVAISSQPALTRALRFDVRDNRIDGSAGYGVDVFVSSDTGLSDAGGWVRNNVIGGSGACSGSGIHLWSTAAGSVPIVVADNAVTCAGSPLTVDAFSHSAELDLTVTGNAIGAGAAGSTPFRISLGTSGDTGTSCLGMTGNSVGATSGTSVALRLDAGGLQVAGLPVGPATSAAVTSRLASANALQGSVTHTLAAGTSYSGVASCPQPTVAP